VTVPGSLSVVIPTLNEASTLPNLLDDLSGLSSVDRIIVSDGGSSDGTRDVARRCGATVVSGPPGRGAQLRAGAETASGSWLAFLHADTRLGPEAAHALDRFVETAGPADFAHFRLRFDRRSTGYRLIEFGQRARERLFGMPYGDQGLIVSRRLYDQVGGFPNWPIMEDVGVVDRLSRHGRRIVLDGTVVTSGRRYRREGPVRAWLRNITLIVAFRLGADPEALATRYRPEGPGRATDAETRHTVVLFAKVPVPGRVKTRLAADLGMERATSIYRELGRRTVDALRSGPWVTTVHVAPPDADSIADVTAWLGTDVQYRGQTPGDLGERMRAAIDDELRGATAVCVVGTDIPGLDESTLRQAFDALETHDVVIGPATDGGYYLIGMTRTRPELFDGIPWSTARVLDLTLERAEAAGLSVARLEPRTDVDTLDDVPPALLDA
jgi:rSAM/selenodomain-associated transferase 2/rSAM/selenodomain-associated transferase 1